MRAVVRVGVLTGSTLLRVLSLLTVTVLLGRSAGAEALGTLSLLLAGAAVFQSVSIGGLSGVAIHRLLVERQDRDGAITVLIASRFILIPLTFGLGSIALLISGIASSIDVCALAIFIGGYAVGSFDVGEIGNTARGRFLLMGSLRLTVIVGMAIPKLSSAATGEVSQVLIFQGIEAALWQLILVPGSGAKFLLMLAACRSLLDGARQIWGFKTLWLSNVMSSLAQRIDLFIVGALVGQIGVGQYSTASRPVEAAVILANSIVAVLFNGMVGASSSPSSYARSCRRTARLVGLVAVVVTVTMIVAGPSLVQILYGPEFFEAALLLPIYAVSLIFLFQRQLLSRILIIEKAYKLSLLSNLAMLVSCVALNSVLIPLMGLTGAALAAVLSHPCSLVLSMTMSRKGRRLLVLSIAAIFMPMKSIQRAARVAVYERQS